MRFDMRILLTLVLGGLLLTGPGVLAQPPTGKARKASLSQTKLDKGKRPVSGRAPAKLVPNLCLLNYRISTDSTDCQAFFNQGLAWFYSYVYGDAVTSFETALIHDPDCAMAWWGLS